MSFYKRLAYKAKLEYRRFSWRMRAEPNVLIIGAQKAGTSSLFDYLSQHPEVSTAYRKEIRFFNAHFRRGIPWYRAHFPLSYHVGSKRVVMEASPGYILYPAVARRIADYNPQMKIIALLRNPIPRAYSHYAMNLRRENVDEPLAFDKAIAAEPQRLASELKYIQDPEVGYSDKYSYYSYLTRGYYYDQLKLWFDYFSSDQMKILEAERLFSRPATVYAEVLEFLGLSDWQPAVLRARNYSGATENLIQTIGEDLHRDLQAHFQPHNERLFDLLGERYDW